MWYCPNKYIKPYTHVNKKLSELRGELSDTEARITLIDFLRSNIGFTVELLSGVKLAPYQELTLKGMLSKNNTMCVWGRGASKSYISAVYCFLQCIFEPGSKILIAGPTFRTSRFIFNYLEKIVESKGAQLLQQAFSAKVSKRNDQFEWSINGGSIAAIPLNGEKVRGFRANVLLVDEYLLMPPDIIEFVLRPFLTAPLDITERMKIIELENQLIANGQLKEEDRIKFENTSKFIALSSASYTFENLYETYCDWKKKIYDEDYNDGNTYFISQLSYEALPKHMIDQGVVEQAKGGGASRASFLREYCAQFVDESDGYFSAKKMIECTLKDGNDPTTLIKGRPGKKYILGIDPSFSKSKASDFFAMSVMELDDEKQDGTLVHGYAVAGGDLKDHIKYLYYLMKNFDIEMIIIDNAGYQFIEAANESSWFKNDHIKIDFVDAETDAEGDDHNTNLKKIKRQWDIKSGKIAFKQFFTSEFIRKANQNLQRCIDHKKIWFASNVRANGSAFDVAMNQNVDLSLVPFDSHGDFVEFQDSMIYQTKVQCALIEVSSTAKGTQTFDLPQHLKRDNSEKRARKDNYTTLMLANWAVKLYYDVKETKVDNNETFSPFMI